MTTPSAPAELTVQCLTGPPNLQLNVAWAQTGDYEGPYFIVVRNSAGAAVGAPQQSGSPTGGSWAGSKVPAGTYTVIVQTSDPTIFGGPVTFPTTSPAGVTTSFDGTIATVTWGAAPGGDSPLAQVKIRNLAGVAQPFPPGPNYHSATVSPAAGLFKADDPLWAQVAMGLGTATGPYSPSVSLLKTRPPVTGIATAISAGAATFSIATSPNSGYAAGQSFVVTLYLDGQPFHTWPPIASAKVGAGLVVAVPMAAIGWPLPGGARYAFSLRQANANAVGPEGLRQSYPAGVPAIAGISYEAVGTGQADLVTLSAAPPPGDADVSGILVALLDASGSIVVSKAVAGFTATLAVKRAAAASGQIAVAAANGPATGALVSASDPLLQAAPSIAGTSYDGAAVTARWPVVNGAIAYEMQLLAAGAPVASMRFVAGAGAAAASGTMAAPPGVTGVTVSAIAGLSRGPAAAPVPLIVAVPDLVSLGFAAGAATARYSFGDATMCLRYRLMNGAGLVEEKTLGPGVKDVPLAASSLAPGGSLTLSAQLVAGAAPLDPPAKGSSGPWSAPAPIVATAPASVRVDFDGSTARIAWQASPPPVSGYRVQILHGAIEADAAVTAGTSIPIDCTALPSRDDYQVVVTPLAGALDGAPSDPVPLFAPGLYPVGGASTPHLLPATAMSLPNTDITLLLPELFTADPAAMPAPGLLALVKLDPAQPPFEYSLTIAAGGGAWAFGQDPIRSAVRAQIVAFRTWLDTHNPLPGTIQLIDAAIGRAMPQTFAETLLYGAGANVGDGYVDLRPGHVLRIGFEGYQNLGTAATKYLNGFVGSADSSYEVRSALGADGRWLLGFDSFLSRFAAYMSVPKPASAGGVSAGGSGLADLYFDGFRQPYCRIVYPPSFLGQDSIGSATAYYNVALVAAQSLADLEAATAALRNRSSDVGRAQLLYFRGRSIVTVAQSVSVNDDVRCVPVGTTVGNLLEGLGARPPAMPLRLEGIRLRRAIGPVISTATEAISGVPLGASLPVRLDWRRDPTQGTGQDWLDLPVLAGDRLEIPGAGPG